MNQADEDALFMRYQSVAALELGSPAVLQIVEHELREPEAGEVRIKVLAASVSRPDITVRQGEALYSGTPLGQKTPFVPGYSVVGDVDAVGEGVTNVAIGDRVGVLTVVGGYTEVLYWCSDRLIPVPKSVDPAEAVTLILNYIVAYQVMHRSAKVKTGDAVLIIGASGGIGTALLQLGKLANLKMYAIASKSKHYILEEYGAIPIDYRTQDFEQVIREQEPNGLNAVFDGMMRMSYISGALSLLKRGGKLVSFGEPEGCLPLLQILATVARVNLLPNGKSFSVYGTSFYFVKGQEPFLEDWATLFQLLEEGEIKPIIMQKFAILEAARANQVLESGTVVGNLVLVSPEFL